MAAAWRARCLVLTAPGADRARARRRRRKDWTEWGPGFGAWVVQLVRYIILLNNMIPISLYVTLELVKVLQCSLLYSCDRKMYHAESDTPLVCRTTTLNEELGQVGAAGRRLPFGPAPAGGRRAGGARRRAGQRGPARPGAGRLSGRARAPRLPLCRSSTCCRTRRAR